MWKKIVLRVLLGLVVLIVILATGAFIYIRHHIQYFDGERLDEAALNAKAEEYMAAAQALENRLKDDRQQMEALIAQVVVTDDQDGRWILDCGCPDVAHKIDEDGDLIDAVRQQDEQYRAILQNGFVLHCDLGYNKEIPHFVPYKRFINLQMEAALQDAFNSRSEAAVDRLLLNRQFINGLSDTPIYISNMIAIALELELNHTLVYMLPYISTTDILRMKEDILSNASPERAHIQSIKAEGASFLEIYDQIGANKVDSYNVISDNRVISRVFGLLFDGLNAQKWERLRYIEITSELIEAYEQWIEQGAKDKPNVYSEVFDLLFSDKILMAMSPTILIAYPDLDSLMTRAWELEHKRAALLAALDAELERRNTGPGQTVTLPYGDDEQIVLGPEHGCIEEKERTAAK